MSSYYWLVVTHRRFELRTIALKVRCSTGWASESLAGVAGFEPTNARIKIWCLTAWRYPYNAVYIITKTKFLQQIYCTFSANVKLFYICSFESIRFCDGLELIQLRSELYINVGWIVGFAPFDLCRATRATQAHIFMRFHTTLRRSALSRRGSQTIHRIVWFSARSNPYDFLMNSNSYNSVRSFVSKWGE